MRLAWVAAVLLACAAPALGQAVSASTPSAPATLNVHPLNFYDFPINTQPVQFGTWDVASGAGLATESLSCLPNPPSGGAPFQEYHSWHGYSSPGPVEYHFLEDGQPRTAPERQMGYDGNISNPVLHWFLATTPGLPVGGPADPDQAPVVVPNVVVEATMRTGEAISVDDKAYDHGPILAHGRSAPALLAADQSQGVVHTMAGGRHVYEFTIPMEVSRAEIGLSGFTLRIDAYLDNPACSAPDREAMPNLVEPFADPQHRPRIELAVSDPVRILSVVPRFTNDSVVVQATAQSVWGNHDIDVGNTSSYDVAAHDVDLSVDGPGGHRDVPATLVLQRMHEYFHHADPVIVDWVLPRANLTAGLYWLNLTVSNDQHTASATAHASFRLGPDVAYPAPAGGGLPDVAVAKQDAPAVGAPLALLALALLAARKRTINNH